MIWRRLRLPQPVLALLGENRSGSPSGGATALEYLAFGRTLEAARFEICPRCKHVARYSSSAKAMAGSWRACYKWRRSHAYA